MICINRLFFYFLFLFSSRCLHAQKNNTINSGVPWFDEKGNAVSAHGANIVKENETYFLFGERHQDGTNAFAGFNCYSSKDLYNWKFVRIALPVQPIGKLDSNSLGERPKVMKCPTTGEYIMYMHADTLGYTSPYVGYATSKKIAGPYTFRGPILFNGKPIKKWDMGTFQDKDGSGYVLLHGGDIFKLTDDYKSISEQVSKAFERGFESPAIFRKDSLYYFLGSDLTGWERNDNYYFTSTSLKGPWTKRGFFAPQGTLTWNSQTTFVLPIEGTKETTYMFMGDRWSFPKQASAATYVWQPLTVSEYNITLPDFKASWKVDLVTGLASTVTTSEKTIAATDSQITYSGYWPQDTLAVKSSAAKGASFSFEVNSTQIGIYGLARPDGGYAYLLIQNSKGEIVLNSIVDFYSKYPALQLKFLSPVLKKDTYKVSVTVLGEKWWWKEKSGRLSGSKGDFVSIEKIVVAKVQSLGTINAKNNPLKGDIRVHDPVMIKQKGTYYVFSTGRGIPFKTSTDKIHWKNNGTVFDSASLPLWFKTDIPQQNGSLWAPDIHYRNGKYYLYYSVSAWMNFNSSVGLVTNTTLDKQDLAYKWVDEGQVISFKNGGEGVNVIDPNIFIDRDGKKYLVYGSYKAGLRMVELDDKTGKLKKNPPDITTLTTSLGEGVFIIKGPKYYYIFASRGRCCAGDSSTYQIVMGRSKNVKGPYLNKQGESWVNNKYSLLLAGDSTEPGRGHNGFFTEHDTTFIVYHAYTRAQKGASLLNIKPMYIDKEGWPTLDVMKKLFRREDD